MQHRRPRTTSSRAAGVLKVLGSTGPSTLNLIAGLLKMNESRVRYTLDRLRAQRKVHIGGWTTGPGRGRVVPIYYLGGQPEAQPPVGARMQHLTNGHDYQTGAHLTDFAVRWLLLRKG
jgi:predicted ArsR family transcriptional regulator